MTVEEVQRQLIEIDPQHHLVLSEVQRQLNGIMFDSPSIEEMLASVARRYKYQPGRGFPLVWLHRLIVANNLRDRRAHPEKYRVEVVPTPASFFDDSIWR